MRECARELETLKDSEISCIPFCLRSLVPLERCDSQTTKGHTIETEFTY